MKKTMLFCFAVLAFLCTGFIFAREYVTDEECERMVKEQDYEAIKRLINSPDLYI
jgi:hypothetical protein